MSKEYFDDSYALYDSEANGNAIDDVKKIDRGFNTVTRQVVRQDGKIKNKKINVFTSSGTGFKIRDAETGDYTPYLVGSKDEDLFFKVGLSTGELNSPNGSNTLFYVSPRHYMNHLYCEIPPEAIASWQEKHDSRATELNIELENKANAKGIKVR